MIEDFQDKPALAKPQAGVDRAIKELAGPGVDFCAISSRTTEPMSVAGSIVGPPCVKCGSHVWLAPSSQRFVDPEKRVVGCCIECYLLLGGEVPDLFEMAKKTT